GSGEEAAPPVAGVLAPHRVRPVRAQLARLAVLGGDFICQLQPHFGHAGEGGADVQIGRMRHKVEAFVRMPLEPFTSALATRSAHSPKCALKGSAWRVSNSSQGNWLERLTGTICRIRRLRTGTIRS